MFGIPRKDHTLQKTAASLPATREGRHCPWIQVRWTFYIYFFSIWIWNRWNILAISMTSFNLGKELLLWDWKTLVQSSKCSIPSFNRNPILKNPILQTSVFNVGLLWKLPRSKQLNKAWLAEVVGWAPKKQDFCQWILRNHRSPTLLGSTFPWLISLIYCVISLASMR